MEPPPDLSYNAYRTWRKSTLGRSTPEEVSEGWARYKEAQGQAREGTAPRSRGRSPPGTTPSTTPRVSPPRSSTRPSPPRSSPPRRTSPRRSPPRATQPTGFAHLPADVMRVIIGMASRGARMGDLLNLCSTSKRVLQLCRDDDLWRRAFEAKYGPQGGLPPREVAVEGIQYTGPVPSWRVWMRLCDDELVVRRIPVTITIAPTTSKKKLESAGVEDEFEAARNVAMDFGLPVQGVHPPKWHFASATTLLYPKPVYTEGKAMPTQRIEDSELILDTAERVNPLFEAGPHYRASLKVRYIPELPLPHDEVLFMRKAGRRKTIAFPVLLGKMVVAYAGIPQGKAKRGGKHAP